MRDGLSSVLPDEDLPELVAIDHVPHLAGLLFALYSHVLVSLSGHRRSWLTISTLVTGSVSHKKVTSDVSRILWLYYNNKVRRAF